MGITVRVTFSNNLAAKVDDIIGGLRSGVGLAGERLLGLSAEQVPVDEGTLMGSGSVSTPLASRDADPAAVVSYDTAYAVRLHEHPEYQFQGGRKGKYLEDPAVQNRKELGDIIRQEVLRGS